MRPKKYTRLLLVKKGENRVRQQLRDVFNFVRRNRIGLVVILLAVAATASLGTYYTWYTNTSSRPVHTFTLIVDTRGYNNSRSHQLPYPLMGVMVGDNVVIRLVNNDSAEAHGLTVQSYVMNGPVARPGETKTVSFQATIGGEFLVQESLMTTTWVFARAKLMVALDVVF